MVQTWALTKIGIFNHKTFTLIINFFEMYNRKAIEQLKKKIKLLGHDFCSLEFIFNSEPITDKLKKNTKQKQNLNEEGLLTFIFILSLWFSPYIQLSHFHI